MPTPTYRTPVRIARGTYSNLNSSIADLLEGEVVYATDQDKVYVKEGGVLVSTQADLSSYLTSATAASTYLTSATAASTYAPLASPALTGAPTAPTPAQGDNTTAIATTAFVNNEISHDLSAAIGVSVQGYDAGLAYLDGLNFTNESTFKQGVNLELGVDVQAYDADTAKTDVVQSFTAAQRGAITALTSATTVTPDFSVTNNFSLTLAHNITLANPTNLTAGQSGSIVITQGSGTAYTVAYGSYWKFSGGTPTMSTGLSSVSTLVYYVESSTRITAQLITNVS